MKARVRWRVWASGVVLSVGIGGAGMAAAQTSATPNPSTLPVPTQTNPAGTGGTNTATPPSDPTPPASVNPAPPPTQSAPKEPKASPGSSNAPSPEQQTSPTGDQPGMQQTSPTGGGNQGIKNPAAQGGSSNPAANQSSNPASNQKENQNPNQSPNEPGATQPAGQPSVAITPGSTTPGAAQPASPNSAGGVGSLNAGGLTSDQLRERIDAALRNEPTLSGSNLQLNVSDDSIDVSGTATTNKERVTARRIVQSFAGNRRVRERITVPGGSGTSNTPASTKPTTPEDKPQSQEKVQKPPMGDPAQQGDRSGDPR